MSPTRAVVAATALALALPVSAAADPPVVIVSAPHPTGWHMPSSSMEPTLHCARPGVGCEAAHPDRLLVRRVASLRRGDIVVFTAPARAATVCGAAGSFVKRIVALPGETWSERRGRIYVDGKRLAEPYVRPQFRDVRSYRPQRLPAHDYLLLGDNRASSCDSRVWGPVPLRNVIGTVVRVFRQR